MMRSLKPLLSPPLLDALYKTCILPIFDYADIIYDPQTQTNIFRLEQLQQRFQKLTQQKKPSTRNSTPTSSRLTLQHRRQLHKLVFMHKLQTNKVPKHLTPLRLRTRSELCPRQLQFPLHVSLPKPRTEALRRSPIYQAGTLWNSVLSEELRATKSTNKFKSGTLALLLK